MTQQDTKHPVERFDRYQADALAAVVLTAAGYGTHWMTAAQYREVTEGAFVEGNLVQMTTPDRGAEMSKVQADFDRRSQLVQSGGISGENIEHAHETVRAA